jgi:hypothetical protein
MPSSEEIYKRFQEYKQLGVIDYVLPTRPLGDEWVLGVKGEIHKLIGNGDAMIWLAGAGAVTVWAHAALAPAAPDVGPPTEPTLSPFHVHHRQHTPAEPDPKCPWCREQFLDDGGGAEFYDPEQDRSDYVQPPEES